VTSAHFECDVGIIATMHGFNRHEMRRLVILLVVGLIAGVAFMIWLMSVLT
jgi:uncharacterized membrane protein